MSLLEELRAFAKGNSRRISTVRGDAKEDAYAVMAPRRYHGGDLQDHTERFLKAIKRPIPESGEVVFVGLPIFADQGAGKTLTGMTLAFELIEYYGWDKLSIYISSHIPSLAEAMRDRATPVQILFVDDALEHYNSRGGGSAEMIDAIGDFNTLRHKLEDAHNTLNGVVIVIFTVQMFKGLDKAFRKGFPIFKSALVEDKDEIISATQMSKQAWEYLSKIARETQVAHKGNRKADSIVCLPGYQAGRLHLPLWSHERLDKLLDHIGTPAAKALKSEKLIAVKYKLIHTMWKIKRRVLSKEEELARLNKLLDDYAMSFARHHEEDASTQEGKAAVRQWLDLKAYGADTLASDRIPIEDYWALKKPRHEKALCEKIVSARKKLALQQTGIIGLGGGGSMTKDQLLTHVASLWLSEGKSISPGDKGVFQSWLYRLDHSFQKEAIRERTAVWSRITEMAFRFSGPAPDSSKRGSQGPAPITVLPDTVTLAGEYFQVDAKLELERLIEEATDKMTLRALTVFKACEFGATYANQVIGSPTKMVDMEEGRQWQLEALDGLLDVPGQPLSRAPLSKASTAGRSYFGNHMGALFEKWTAEKLKAGFVIPGIFDRARIMDVRLAGGNGHEPDIVVVYEGGLKDYVSLKCYSSPDPFSITSNPAKKDEIQPERKALLEDERKGITGNRVVVVARNLAIDGLQGVRKFVQARDIPDTMGFNRDDINTHPWVKAGTVRDSPRASKPEGDGIGLLTQW